MEARMANVDSGLLLQKFPKLKAIKSKIKFYTKAGNTVRVDQLHEEAIQVIIDSLWDKYDEDKSGALDQVETKTFVKEIMAGLGQEVTFSDEGFEELFISFDKDGSGNVEKDEMVEFVKKLLPRDWANDTEVMSSDEEEPSVASIESGRKSHASIKPLVE